jgi:hypothetical protein
MKRWHAALLLAAALWALLLWTPRAKPAPGVAPHPEPVAPITPPQRSALVALATPPQPTAAAPAAAAEPPQPVHATRLPQIMDMPPPQPQGPVRALEQRFASESASASSRENEAKVRAAFMRFNPPPELLEDVVCRRRVCRITARWRQERGYAFTISLNELRVAFDRNLGIAEPGPPDAERVRRVDVYLDVTPAP